MASLPSTVSLRPLRMAFLVPPNDVDAVTSAFRVNTCLWGGKYNPIIPVFKRLPSWWDRGVAIGNAREVLNGYLDYFEPDLLVEAREGLADGIDFDPKRVVQIADVLEGESERHTEQVGQSVFDLYRSLYNREFKFAQRHEHDMVAATTGIRGMTALAACLFGSFPKEPELQYFERAFVDVFSPREIDLTGHTMRELYEGSFTTALKVGHAGVDVRFQNHEDPTLFVFDGSSIQDLVDYWNLRGVREQLVPIPMQWLPELSPFCREYVEKYYRPLPGNPNGVMIRPKVLFGRAIPTDLIQPLFDEHLRVPTRDANLIQDWYPTLWRPTPGFVVRQTRPILSAAERSFEGSTDDEEKVVRFQTLSPDFADRFGGDWRWANVVRVHNWGGDATAAITRPTNYREHPSPRLGMGSNYVISNTEGIVCLPRYKDGSERLHLNTGTKAVSEWLKARGVAATLSDAGRSTQQIIETLGGFYGVAAIASSGVVQHLNSLARSGGNRAQQVQAFRNVIGQAVKDDAWKAEAADRLIMSGAVELGLEVRCTRCDNWSWYALHSLSHNLTCSLCLKDFEFPRQDPSGSKSSRWAYRLSGPFALPDYARGGYAAALAIRVFANVVADMHDGLTWSSGQRLSFDGREVEADFILWHQRRRVGQLSYPAELIFGEAKSFGKDRFQSIDISRMRDLSQRFPGAILVFATMREAHDIAREELKAIAQLAMWGRRKISGENRTRAPVVLLTGTELFASYHLRDAWESAGGRRAELVKPGWVDVDNIRTLADLTQQAYLGLPSYHSWLEEYWKRRHAARAARAPMET